jgi:hypothetical protein
MNGKSSPPVRSNSRDTVRTQTPPPQPASISTDIVESVPDDAPWEPALLVICDGCDKGWAVMDEPLYTCADCVGEVQLDRQCHALLMKDQLKKKGFRCKKEHKYFEIPKWDAERFKDVPRGCLPLPASVSKERRWIPLDEWKRTLRELYLPDKAGLVGA